MAFLVVESLVSFLKFSSMISSNFLTCPLHYIYIYIHIHKTIVRAGTGKDVRLATTPKWAPHHHHQHRTITTSCVEDPGGLDFVPRRSPGKFFFGFARGELQDGLRVYIHNVHYIVSLNSLDIP